MRVIQRIHVERLLNERKGESQNGPWVIQEYMVKSVTDNVNFVVSISTKYINLFRESIGSEIDV